MRESEVTAGLPPGSRASQHDVFAASFQMKSNFLIVFTLQQMRFAQNAVKLHAVHGYI